MSARIELSGGRQRRKPEPKRKADLVSEQAVDQAVARAKYVLRAAGDVALVSIFLDAECALHVKIGPRKKPEGWTLLGVYAAPTEEQLRADLEAVGS